MKVVFIVFNQTNTERVEYIFDILNIRGYTWFQDVKGRGTKDGLPRQGTHTWPEMNSAAMIILPEDQVPALLEKVKKMDELNQEIGVKAFVWNIEQVV
ncbi:MAG: hypothetical protein P4L28_08340 [Paludibacteraceae bacterium]|nr:hypothetical protein [Paludibacteraceae bacterium]